MRRIARWSWWLALAVAAAGCEGRPAAPDPASFPAPFYDPSAWPF